MTIWAFLDESGDPNIDVENGATTHYAVGAVVVPEAGVVELRARVEAVRRKFFQTGEIKSKTVSSKSMRRRLSVLQALDETGYRMLGLVVDKRRLFRDSGLQYRQSFVKYVNRFVYDRLFRAYGSLRIRADQHGRAEFMESFQAYLKANYAQTTLFDAHHQPEFVTSDSDVLIQAADFVAGSLRIAYGDDTKREDAEAILSHFRRSSLGIQEWPAVARTQAALSAPAADAVADTLVRQISERSAYVFLSEVEDATDDNARMQMEVLQELMHSLRFEDSGSRSAESLATTLQERGYRDCTRDQVRRSVIAPMRDREVLIVSSEKGYALASRLADVETHVRRMEQEVRPILRRVQTMEETIKRVSVGRVSLLTGGRFAYLQGLLERHQNLERYASEAQTETLATDGVS